MHQQHAKDTAEMILLQHDQGYFESLINVSLLHTYHTYTHFKLDILVLVNQILFSGGNPALYIAHWIEAEIGEDLHSSYGPNESMAVV